MAKTTPPRKKRFIQAAYSASTATSVEPANSNCPESTTIEEIAKYEIFGFGKTKQTYAQGSVTDFSKIEDQELQVTGRDADGATVNIKNLNNLISRAMNAGLSTTAQNHYFSTTGDGVTGSAVLNNVYTKNGPQAGYIPQLIHGAGLGTTQEYVFFMPSTVTGAAQPNGHPANMPVNHSRSFEITIAGAVAPGESVQVYTASADNVYVATGSAFTYSGSFCSTPNYQFQQMHIPTASLLGVAGAGIVIKYTASYAEADNKENTPYAGVTVTINPSALIDP